MLFGMEKENQFQFLTKSEALHLAVLFGYIYFIGCSSALGSIFGTWSFWENEDFPFFEKKKKKKALRGYLIDTIMGVSNAYGPLGGAIENIMSYQPTYHLFVFLRFFVFFLKLFTLDGHHVG